MVLTQRRIAHTVPLSTVFGHTSEVYPPESVHSDPTEYKVVQKSRVVRRIQTGATRIRPLTKMGYPPRRLRFIFLALHTLTHKALGASFFHVGRVLRWASLIYSLTLNFNITFKNKSGRFGT